MAKQSARAQLVERRTYLRPASFEDDSILETPQQALDRQISHQHYLWEAAQGSPLTEDQELELEELRALLVSKKASLSGRVKWMADTDVIRERPAAAFNCSFTQVELPADVVDVFWLLLQGCGVGFQPIPGLMTGFGTAMEIEFVGSDRDPSYKGREKTLETFDKATGTWTLAIGDSAKAWAKAAGKLLTNKVRAKKLVIDLSELRGPGSRLRGYGWLSSGWQPLQVGFQIMVDVLNRKAGRVLDAIDILDIVNALGTVLSSRRSAQIAMLPVDHDDIDAFMEAKVGKDDPGGPWWRSMSNNSVMFNRDPTRAELERMFDLIWKNGDPGFYNLVNAQRRAPWARGANPCVEILLPSKGFCNLVQIVPHRFKSRASLGRALWIIARANYRQTCVDMRDGVLQLPWNDNNRLLRLCGVSFTGYIAWDGADDPEALRWAREQAHLGADSMADELGLNRAALVTQIQPGGTVSKALGLVGDELREGAHGALGRYVFNRVGFSKHDPLVTKLREAGYEIEPNPYDELSGVLVKFPVEYSDGSEFTTVQKQVGEEKVYKGHGDFDILPIYEEIEVNLEPAIKQLERYKTLMENYIDHNCSITISYNQSEVPEIIDWLLGNWDSFVGVSFMKRTDPTLTKEQFEERYGHKYLPQEPVSKSRFDKYVAKLSPVVFDDNAFDGVDMADCATGACPVR